MVLGFPTEIWRSQDSSRGLLSKKKGVEKGKNHGLSVRTLRRPGASPSLKIRATGVGRDQIKCLKGLRRGLGGAERDRYR